MTRFIKKIQHFRLKLHQRDTFKTQFVDTLFSTISKHLPFNSISTKFSPRLVSNHACEFLVGPTQNQDEETKKSHGIVQKKPIQREEANLYNKLPIHLKISI